MHHYSHTNVEAQLAQPTSLLHWVRGMLAVRRQHPALGAGEFEVLACDNESVLAFCRHTADETLLVVANMASTARAATVAPARPRGLAHARRVRRRAVRARSAPTAPRSFTLGSRDFYWLELTAP